MFSQLYIAQLYSSIQYPTLTECKGDVTRPQVHGHSICLSDSPSVRAKVRSFLNFVFIRSGTLGNIYKAINESKEQVQGCRSGGRWGCEIDLDRDKSYKFIVTRLI